MVRRCGIGPSTAQAKDVWAARREAGTRTPYQFSGLRGFLDLGLDLDLGCGFAVRFGGWVGEGEDGEVGGFTVFVLGSAGLSYRGEMDASAIVSPGTGPCGVSSGSSQLGINRSVV